MADETERKITRGTALRLIAGGFALLPLAACGKKGPPKAPSGSQAPYPRSYPAPVNEAEKNEATSGDGTTE